MWASGFYRHEYTYILKDTNLKTFLKENYAIVLLIIY